MWLSGITEPALHAAETVQTGFVLHDEGKANISLSGVHSGELCADLGGADTVCNIGKLTFVYQLAEEDRSAISVVTGIQGPVDGANRPMELLAHFHLRQPDRSHQQRLACLFDIARRSLDCWFSKVDPATNTVKLDEPLPDDFRPSCAAESI